MQKKLGSEQKVKAALNTELADLHKVTTVKNIYTPGYTYAKEWSTNFVYKVFHWFIVMSSTI